MFTYLPSFSVMLKQTTYTYAASQHADAMRELFNSYPDVTEPTAMLELHKHDGAHLHQTDMEDAINRDSLS